jgi:hypothetical protein
MRTQPVETNRYKSTFGFVDLLFNLLVGFTFLFMLAFILINPVAKKEVLDPKAEYLIVVSWDDKSQNDIDVWVKDNDGNAVSFRSKDIALMNIDRDDLGARNDTFAEIVGEKDKIEVREVNREVVSIRSKSPRTYVVTVHYYGAGFGKKLNENVTIELIKINPYKILKIKDIYLEDVRQEKHVFKFEVLESGDVVFHESEELIIFDMINKSVPSTSVPYMDQ